MDVLVVGAGAMGRWFGASVVDAADLAFADADPDAATDAAEAVGGRAVPLDGEETYDAVCLAVPIPAVEEAVEAQAHRAERALLDVAGVMADPVEAMAAVAPDRERVSLHPLFAPANAPGSIAVVPEAPGPVTDRLRVALAARGNTLFETTPGEHDSAMESVQAAAHATVLAYGLAAGDVREEFHTPVSAALADLVEEVTGGEPRVYADVQATFDGAGAVAEAAERLATADHETFERLYEAARGDERGRDGVRGNGRDAVSGEERDSVGEGGGE